MDSGFCRGGILLLSNNRNVFPLYQWLNEQEESVYLYSGKLTEEQIRVLSPDWIISYNYGRLIPKYLIELVENRIINLHISYLPWNKGSDPNFWSFMENTPKGVTIHQLSDGLDEGDILLQKELYFDERVETFQTTYDALNHEIVSLFQENWDRIKKRFVTPKKQMGKGSHHRRKDFVDFLNEEPLNLQETIYEYKLRKMLKQ